jgi:hypothetical protein
LADQGTQRSSSDELHDDEGSLLVNPLVVDRADVRVIELRGGAGFPLKSLQRLGARGKLAGQELQGHRSSQAQLAGLEDMAHAAAPQEPRDLVAWHARRWFFSRRRRLRNRLFERAQRHVNLEVQANLLGQTGEPLLVFCQLRRLAALLAQKDFPVDQVENRVLGERGLGPQVILEPNLIAARPACFLVGQQRGGAKRRRRFGRRSRWFLT